MTAAGGGGGPPAGWGGWQRGEDVLRGAPLPACIGPWRNGGGGGPPLLSSRRLRQHHHHPFGGAPPPHARGGGAGGPLGPCWQGGAPFRLKASHRDAGGPPGRQGREEALQGGPSEGPLHHQVTSHPGRILGSINSSSSSCSSNSSSCSSNSSSTCSSSTCCLPMALLAKCSEGAPPS
ncbi:hypothetical protein Emed_007277 [Eimeria media]